MARKNSDKPAKPQSPKTPAKKAKAAPKSAPPSKRTAAKSSG